MSRLRSANASQATLISGVTSVYFLGIDNAEILGTIDGRGAPTMPASAALRI